MYRHREAYETFATDNSCFKSIATYQPKKLHYYLF